MAISLAKLRGLFAAAEKAQARPTSAARPMVRKAHAVPQTAVVKQPAQGDYRAVSVVSGNVCCGAAASISGKRFLLADTPRLPLDGCSNPANCTCTYRKHADRRSGEDRRLTMPGEQSQWYLGMERRNPRGRRHDD